MARINAGARSKARRDVSLRLWRNCTVAARQLFRLQTRGRRRLLRAIYFASASLTSRSRASRFVFSFCPARPERPLWRRDGLGAPDSLLGRAGRKGLLGRAAGSG